MLFSGFNLDTTQESYNQDPPLSIHPKILPFYLRALPVILKNTVTGYSKSVTRSNKVQKISKAITNGMVANYYHKEGDMLLDPKTCQKFLPGIDDFHVVCLGIGASEASSLFA